MLESVVRQPTEIQPYDVPAGLDHSQLLIGSFGELAPAQAMVQGQVQEDTDLLISAIGTDPTLLGEACSLNMSGESAACLFNACLNHGREIAVQGVEIATQLGYPLQHIPGITKSISLIGRADTLVLLEQGLDPSTLSTNAQRISEDPTPVNLFKHSLETTGYSLIELKTTSPSQQPSQLSQPQAKEHSLSFRSKLDCIGRLALAIPREWQDDVRSSQALIGDDAVLNLLSSQIILPREIRSAAKAIRSGGFEQFNALLGRGLRPSYCEPTIEAMRDRGKVWVDAQLDKPERIWRLPSVAAPTNPAERRVLEKVKDRHHGSVTQEEVLKQFGGRLPKYFEKVFQQKRALSETDLQQIAQHDTFRKKFPLKPVDGEFRFFPAFLSQLPDEARYSPNAFIVSFVPSESERRVIRNLSGSDLPNGKHLPDHIVFGYGYDLPDQGLRVLLEVHSDTLTTFPNALRKRCEDLYQLTFLACETDARHQGLEQMAVLPAFSVMSKWPGVDPILANRLYGKLPHKLGYHLGTPPVRRNWGDSLLSEVFWTKDLFTEAGSENDLSHAFGELLTYEEIPFLYPTSAAR